MSKYDLMKNIAKKNSSKNTADSSKVSKPNQTATRYTDTGTGQTRKVTTASPQATSTYWQADQQAVNRQATAQKQKTVQRKALTGSMKRQAQVAEKEKRNKYAEATRNAQKFDPNAQQDYSQFNAGVKAIIPSLFSKRSVAGEMANYTNRNRKQIAQDMAGRQRQAGYAQSAVDKANADIAGNDLTKTFSDLGMKGIGGLTSSVGGLIRGGSNLVQGFAGLTGNQDLARQALQFDRNLGTDEAIANINRNNSQANTFAGQVAESIGGMIPTIGANLVGGFAGVGEQAGLGLMGASVFGNSGSEAFNNLSEDGELSQIDALRALGYGAGSAGLEVGTEMLSGALGKLAGSEKLAGTAIGRALGGLDTFAFNSDNLLGQAAGEALEEMISSAAEPLISPMANQNVRNAQQYAELVKSGMFTEEQLKEILRSGLLGAGTSLAMGAPSNIPNVSQLYNNARTASEQAWLANERNTMTPEQRAMFDEIVRGLRDNGLDEYINTFTPQMGADEYTTGRYNPWMGERFADYFSGELTPEMTQPEPTMATMRRSDERAVAPEYRTGEYTPRASEARESFRPADYLASAGEDMSQAQDTYDRTFSDFMDDTMRATDDVADALDPEERMLTQRQMRDVAEEYRTDEIKPVDTQEEITPEPEYVIPEDYQPDLSDEDTISDGEYRESDEGLTDDEDYDELEYVPTGDTDVDAVGRLKAAEEADPSNPGRADDAYNAGIADVLADTDIPEEVANQIKGDLNINKTAERLAEGDAVAFNQTNIPETDAPEYKQKIAMATDDVAYETTRLKPVKDIAKQMNNKVGGIDQVFDDLMKSGPSDGKASRFGKAVLNQFGIQTDYEAVLYTARVSELKDQIGAEMKRVTSDIESKGYKVEIVPTATGDSTVRVMKDGKAVNPADLSESIKELSDLAAKNDDVTLRATNIGHNVGTLLRLFRTDLLSPAGQIKGVNQTVEAINAELDKKFAKQIKSGQIEHVKLDDEKVKTFLEATDDATRAAIMEEMGADIGSQIPPTFMEKLDAFRYNNLLFNGLTWFRNGIGNLTQSQMANAKNISLYALESWEKLRGHVRYNNLDMSNASDRAILNQTSKKTSDFLLNDFADAKNSKRAKSHLRSLGYDGSLLNTLQHYKGKSFNFSQIDANLNARLNEKVANNAKEAGYTVVGDQIVDKNGNQVDDKTYRKLINDSFKQAKKQWLSSDDLRMAKADGIGKGRANRTQRDLFWNEGFDLLNPDYESVAGLKMDNANVTGKDAFQKGLNEARRSNTFSDKNPFGWTENRISRVIDYAMNKAPLLGDDFWLRSGYSKAMASMLDTQGYHAEVNNGNIELYDRNGDLVPEGKANRVLTELNQEALQWAKEDTYHDLNPLANLLNDFARQGSLAKFAVNATVPFVNTPMNIARRAIEYSPIGIMSSIAQITKVKDGKISASTWLNNLSKGATGASAMLIGAYLAKIGFLRALGDKDDEQIRRFEQAKGLQNYSIQIPGFDGWSSTVDWLAPGVAPFLLGAALFEQHSQYVPRSKDETKLQGALNLAGEDFANFGTLFRPIADTTMLSGLMDTLSVFGDEDWARELVATTTQNYLRQLTPVLGSKIHGIIDPVKYSTSSDSFLDSQLRAAAINIRLIDYAMTAMNDGEKYLQPQLDLNGKPIETQDYGMGAAGRAITNLINPATVKEDTRDATDKELERLYNKQTGKKDYFLPSMSASYNGIHFTPKERTEFNQYYLSSYKKAAEEFIKSPMYNDYDDKERYQILYSMKNHYFAEAQKKYLGRIVPNTDDVLTKRDKACDYANSIGVSTPKYYRYIYTSFDTDKDGNNINNTRAMKVRAQMEADGVWEQVKKAIDDKKFEPGDFNLNKLVTGWDTTEYTYYYNQMLNGQYDGKNRKKK